MDDTFPILIDLGLRSQHLTDHGVGGADPWCLLEGTPRAEEKGLHLLWLTLNMHTSRAESQIWAPWACRLR